MVKTVYTEQTPLQPADFTAAAGVGASAWAKQFSTISDKAYDEAHTLALSKAATDGMMEGLKGTDAETAESTTEVQRKYNESVQKTAGSVVTNQLRDYATNLRNQIVSQYGNTREGVAMYGQALGAYSQSVSSKLSAANYVAFGKTASILKQQAEREMLKGVATQSANNQKALDYEQTNKNINNVHDLATATGGSFDPIKINNLTDYTKNVRDQIYNSSISPAAKAKAQKDVNTGLASGISKNVIRSLVRTMDSITELKPPDGSAQFDKLHKQVMAYADPNSKPTEDLVGRILSNHPELSVEDVRDAINRNAQQAIKGFGQTSEDASNDLKTAQGIVKNHVILTGSQEDNLKTKQPFMKNKAGVDLLLKTNDLNRNTTLDITDPQNLKAIQKQQAQGNLGPINFLEHRGRIIQTDPRTAVEDVPDNNITQKDFPLLLPQDAVSNLVSYNAPSALTELPKTNISNESRAFNLQANQLQHEKQINQHTPPYDTLRYRLDQYGHYFDSLNGKNELEIVQDMSEHFIAGASIADLTRGFNHLRGQKGYPAELIDERLGQMVGANGKNRTSVEKSGQDLLALKDNETYWKDNDKNGYKIVHNNYSENAALNAVRRSAPKYLYKALKTGWWASYLADATNAGSLDTDADNLNENVNKYLNDHGFYTTYGSGFVSMKEVNVPGWEDTVSKAVTGQVNQSLVLLNPTTTKSGQKVDINPTDLQRGLTANHPNENNIGEFLISDEQTKENILNCTWKTFDMKTVMCIGEGGGVVFRKVGKGKNITWRPYTLSVSQLQGGDE